MKRSPQGITAPPADPPLESLMEKVLSATTRPWYSIRAPPPLRQTVGTHRLHRPRSRWASDKARVGRLGSNFSSTGARLSCRAWQGSQAMEDQYAYNTFFFGRGGGVFLEAGALDGVHFSNTVSFEQQLGWRGILIEASPSSFKRLASNRPKQLNVHAALCRGAGTVHWADSLGTTMGVRTAGAVSGVVEFMAPRFKRRFYKWVPGGAANLTGTPVECVPLSAILEAFGFRRINWFSLDVEGGELEVLRSFDFSAVRVDVVNVEADGLNPGKDEGVRELMRSNGFRLHAHTRLGRNDWFVREGFEPSASPECGGGGGRSEGCVVEQPCRPYGVRNSHPQEAPI